MPNGSRRTLQLSATLQPPGQYLTYSGPSTKYRASEVLAATMQAVSRIAGVTQSKSPNKGNGRVITVCTNALGGNYRQHRARYTSSTRVPTRGDVDWGAKQANVRNRTHKCRQCASASTPTSTSCKCLSHNGSNSHVTTSPGENRGKYRNVQNRQILCSTC